DEGRSRLVLRQVALIARYPRHGQSGGKTADEQQDNPGQDDGGFNVIRHKREEQHWQATQRQTDGSPHGYGSRSPEGETDQRRTKHRANAKRYSIEGHNPIVIPPLSQVDKLRAAAPARDIIEESILANVQGERKEAKQRNERANTRQPGRA